MTDAGTLYARQDSGECSSRLCCMRSERGRETGEASGSGGAAGRPIGRLSKK